MAPATAFGFLLLGLSLLFAATTSQRAAAPGAGVAGLLVGWLGLSRFVFGGEPLFAFSDMAVHTALLFLLSVAGALTLRTDAGIAALLVSDGVGGAMARRLLPAAIIVPLAAGALTVHYERRATFGFEAAVAVFALLEHDRVRGLRVDQRRARRPCRPAATPGRTRAAAIRGTQPAQSSRPRSTASS